MSFKLKFFKYILGTLLMVNGGTFVFGASRLEVKKNSPGYYSTIQEAVNAALPGDEVLVHPGDYPESVMTAKHGLETSPIVIRGLSANGIPQATVRQFQIRHRYTTVDSFIVSRPPSDQAHIVFGANGFHKTDGSFSVLRNSILENGVYLSSSKLVMNSANRTITTQEGSFLQAGFRAGMTISISSHLDLLNETSFQTRKIIQSVTDSIIVIEGNQALVNEGPIAGIISSTNHGVVFESQDGMTVTNCLVENNVIRNLFGHAFQLGGKGHRLEGNHISRMNGFDIFRLSGEDHIVRRNAVVNNPVLKGVSNHSDIFQCWGNQGQISMRMLIEYNVFERYEGQISMLESDGSSSVRDWEFRNNVFAYIDLLSHVGIPYVTFKNNVFFHTNAISFYDGRFGGDGDYGSFGVVKNNAFISIGDRNDGFYSSDANTTMAETDYNYVGGGADGISSVSTFKNKELHGVNGGDPKFQSPISALGMDGKPFTADDGFRPLSGSVLVGGGENGTTIGAYVPVGCSPGDNVPISIASIAPIYGHAPLDVTLNGGSSALCAPEPIQYRWEFGDGSPSSSLSSVTHRYQPGLFTAKLTVTDSKGKTASDQKTITVLPPHVSGLQLYLNFDNTLMDWSGQQQESMWTAAPNYGTGKFNQGAVFVGSSQGSAIQVDHKPGLDGMAQLTLALWMKRDLAGTSGRVLLKHTVYGLTLTQTGLSGLLYTGASIRNEFVASMPVDTAWHHVALTYDGSKIHVYVDGQLTTSTNASGTLASNALYDLVIGKDPFGPSPLVTLDEMMLFNRALSSSEVDGLFRSVLPDNPPQDPPAEPSQQKIIHLSFDSVGSSGEISDQSGLGNHGVCQKQFHVNNDPANTLIVADQCPVLTPGVRNQAAQFSGSVCKLDSDYVAVKKSASLSLLSKGTISLWINYAPPSDPAFQAPYSSPNYQHILDGATRLEPQSWFLGREYKNFTSLQIMDSQGTPQQLIRFSDAQTENTWNHYAIVWDGMNIAGYLNGVLDQSASMNNVTALVLGEYLNIGALKHNLSQNAQTSNCKTYYPDSIAYHGYPADQKFVMPNHGFFVGKLDDLQIFNYPLTEAGIKALFNGGVLPPPPSGKAPSVTQHPVNRSVQVGQTAGFSVTATGSAPFSYQWFKNGHAISGATNPSYTTPAVVIGDNGSKFYCEVKNTVGVVTSSTATLSVTAVSGTLPTDNPENPNNPPSENIVNVNQSQFLPFKNILKKGEDMVIRYQLFESGPVKLELRNRHGEVIRVFHVDESHEKDGSVRWDGLNSQGDQVSSGSYLLELSINGAKVQKKVVVVR